VSVISDVALDDPSTARDGDNQGVELAVNDLVATFGIKVVLEIILDGACCASDGIECPQMTDEDTVMVSRTRVFASRLRAAIQALR
jgi:hypothetical protein